MEKREFYVFMDEQTISLGSVVRNLSHRSFLLEVAWMLRTSKLEASKLAAPQWKQKKTYRSNDLIRIEYAQKQSRRPFDGLY